MGGLTIFIVLVVVGALLFILAMAGSATIHGSTVGPIPTAGRVGCGFLGVVMILVALGFGVVYPWVSDRGPDSASAAAAPPASPSAAATPSSSPEPVSAKPAADKISARTVGKLDLVLPTTSGRLPKSNIDVQVRGAFTDPLDSVWVGIHNKDDTDNRWNFYACTNAVQDADYWCRDVVVGKTVTSAGPWTIVAVHVDAKGNALITRNRPALVAPDLVEAFGSSLKAYGAKEAIR